MKSSRDDSPESGIITDIKPVKRDTSRVAVFVEKVYIGSLLGSRLEELNLKVGSEISEKELEALLDETQITKATLSSLNLLSYRARSEGEILQRLKRKGFSQQIINKVIARLYGWNYLDDRRFAEEWVKHRTKRKQPYGSKFIRYELKLKSIDDEIIEEVLGNIDERALCEFSGKEAVRRLTRKYEGSKLRERLYDYLMRRGFPSGIILDVIDDLLKEEELR